MRLRLRLPSSSTRGRGRKQRSEEHEGDVPRTAAIPLGETLRAAAHPLTSSAGDYRYGCFDHFGEDSQAYGYAAEVGMSPAEQNARLVKNAEEYYRTMFRGRVSSWNLRDRHMAETLEALLAVEPLDMTAGWKTGEVPETYPFGE